MSKQATVLAINESEWQYIKRECARPNTLDEKMRLPILNHRLYEVTQIAGDQILQIWT